MGINLSFYQSKTYRTSLSFFLVLCISGLLFATNAYSSLQEPLEENTWIPINWNLNIKDDALPSGTDTSMHKQRTVHWYGGLTYNEISQEILVMDGYFGIYSTANLGKPSIYANSLFGMDPLDEKYTLHKTSNYRNGYLPLEELTSEWTPVPRHTYDCWAYVEPTNSVYMINGANKNVSWAAKDDIKEMMLEYGPEPWVQENGQKTLGMWKYSFDDKRWYSLHASAVWPKVQSYEGSLIYVPTHERIYLFPNVGNVYSFNIHTEEWRDENVAINEWSRYRGSTFLDPKRDRVVFYSGKANGNENFSDLGVFDLESKQFSILKVNGQKPPGPRSDGAIAYDSQHDLYVAFGGAGSYTDNWVFNPKTNTWQQFQPKQNIPLDSEHTHLDMAYDSKNNLHIVSRAKGGPNNWFAMRFNPATADFVDPDETAPSTPQDLQASVQGSDQIKLSWTESSDNTAVAGYEISINGASNNHSDTASFLAQGLPPSTTYTFAVAAYDGAGNVSDQSASVSATTTEAAQTDLPAPVNLAVASEASDADNSSPSDNSDDDGSANENPGDLTLVTSFTLREKSGVTTDNYPVTFGHPFAQGDVPQGSKVALRLKDGSFLDTQFEWKRSWPDGSCKHAVISAVLPQVKANSDLEMELVQGSDIQNHISGPMNKSAILDTGVESEISLSNLSGSDYSGTRKASLRDTVAAGSIGTNPSTGSSLDYWLSGSVCTEILARTPIKDDFGRPQMNAYWETRFYPDSSFGPRISVSVENVESHYRGDIGYDVAISQGETTPKQVYSKSAVAHSFQSRWRKVFWMGQEPPDVELRYDPEYLISTQLVMNYDTSLHIPEEALADGGLYLKSKWKGYSTWLNTDHDILDHGFIELMGTGGREEDGVLPGWAVKWILTQDRRMWEIMLGHGDLAGGMPIHWRESDGGDEGSSGKMQRYPFQEDGHVISIEGRPTVWTTPDRDNRAKYESDNLPPDLGEQTSTWSAKTWAHWPSLAYMPYLVTGDRYYLDELYYIANQTASGRNYSYRGYDAGIVSDQVRGQAWKLRDILHAASLAPDSEAEKAYFERWISNNVQAKTEDVQSYAPIHWWGMQVAGNKWDVRHRHSPWESDFVLTVLAHARELGYNSAEMDSLFSTFSSFLINRCTHQDFNNYNVGLYVYPAKNAQGNDFTSWGELDAFIRTVADWKELPSPDNTNSYRYFALGAASTITGQSPSEAPDGNGQDAYSFLNANVDGGESNPDRDAALAYNPTWALVPR